MTKRLNDATADEWTRAAERSRKLSEYTMCIDDHDWFKVYQDTKEQEAVDFHDYIAQQKANFWAASEDDSAAVDNVNNPSHYNKGGIECIDYIKQVLAENFGDYCQGNVTKYLHRWRYKNGVEDLEKAQWYLNEMIKHEKGIGE
jgi:hypothetical protein